jgi:CRP/FNR family cyclic AMP-dependent transcriptional regulator
MSISGYIATNGNAISIIGAGIGLPSGYPPPERFRGVSDVLDSGAATGPAMPALSAVYPILGQITEPDRRALLQWAKIRDVKRGDMVARQGDRACAVVVVLEGYLKVWTLLPDLNEALLEILGPGDSTGELSALQESPREANLTALTRGRLVLIDARQFRQTIDRQPHALHAILHSVAGGLKRATEQLLDSRSLSVRERLAKALIRLARISGSVLNGSARLPFRLSQSELGSMIGTCRENVNKYLGLWRDAGWIEMSAGAVISVDVAAISGLLFNEADNVDVLA